MLARTIFHFGAFLLLAACASAPEAPDAKVEAPDREAILATVDAFFLALAAGDADSIEALSGDRTLSVAIRADAKAPPRYGDLSEIVAGFRAGKAPKVVEPYWSPTVMQRAGLAIVWAPYEVSLGGKLIHCGIDQFTLSRHADGWKIDAVAYTAEPDACEELRPADRAQMRPKFPEGAGQ
jgi:hypothetical protein